MNREDRSSWAVWKSIHALKERKKVPPKDKIITSLWGQTLLLEFPKDDFSLSTPHPWAQWKGPSFLNIPPPRESNILAFERAVFSCSSISLLWQKQSVALKWVILLFTILICPSQAPFPLPLLWLATCMCNTTDSSPYSLRPWSWNQHVPPTRKCLPTKLYGVIIQNTKHWMEFESCNAV
jgi:hypothetical protein